MSSVTEDKYKAKMPPEPPSIEVIPRSNKYSSGIVPDLSFDRGKHRQLLLPLCPSPLLRFLGDPAEVNSALFAKGSAAKCRRGAAGSACLLSMLAACCDTAFFRRRGIIIIIKKPPSNCTKCKPTKPRTWLITAYEENRLAAGPCQGSFVRSQVFRA